jgi:phage shock protein C
VTRKRKRGFAEYRRNRLYKNRDERVVAGVCAGLADYLGFDLVATRVLVAVGAFFSPPFFLFVYLILALVLDDKPVVAETPLDEEKEAVTRRVRSEPHATLSSVRYRFRELDQRLQRIEKYVVSDRFRLDREFEGLID